MSEVEQIILPKGFRRCEYLQASGQQWLNLPITTKIGDKVVLETECRFQDASNQAEGKDGKPYFFFGIRDGKWYCGSGTYSVSSITADTEWHKFKLIYSQDDTGLYVDDVKIQSQTYDSTSILLNGTICAYRTYNGNFYHKSLKKSWKLYINDELVYDLIPCLDENDVACMYDLISQQPIYNQGSTTFSYELANTEVHVGVIHKLPDGFTKVDYLLANGQQWIDTKYVPTNKTGYYLKAQIYTTITCYYFGSNETTTWDDNKRIYFGYYYGSGSGVRWGWMTKGDIKVDEAIGRNREIKLSYNFLNSRVSKATLSKTDFIYNLPDLDFTPTRNIYLFGINLGDTSGYGLLRGRINSFIISEGSEIVRKFVPCLDADGIPCMYELYTGTAHYNRGKGHFTAPGQYQLSSYNLPAGFKKCVYLQASGTQYIDTGVYPNNETGMLIKALEMGKETGAPIGSGNKSPYVYPPREVDNPNRITYTWHTWTQSSENNSEMLNWNKAGDLDYISYINLYNNRLVHFKSEETYFIGHINKNILPQLETQVRLFNWSVDSSMTNSPWKGRIYRAQITQGDSLIHDYVPCLDAEGRPCMYDLIDEIPLYNQSGGTEFAYCVEHQLPSDFIKLKYLESTGTQYIKTGYVPTNISGIYVDAYNVKPSGSVLPVSLRNTNGNTYFSAGRMTTSGYYAAGFGWGSFYSLGNSGDSRYEATLNFLNDRKSIITAPIFVQKVNSLGTLSFTPSIDLCMFGNHNYDGTYLSGCWRIYQAKISEGSEVVRDYVPAFDENKLKPCMYDIINNVAYYNDGEGEFLYNNDFEGTYEGFGTFATIGNKLGSYNYEDEEE